MVGFRPALTFPSQAQSGVVFVSTSYRKNPEHFIPAMHDDADSALNWIRNGAVLLNLNECRLFNRVFLVVLPQRHDLLPLSCRAIRVAVMGESAGGNLACSLAHSRRAVVSFGLYLCPILDLGSFDTTSWTEYGADGANFLMERREVQSMVKV